MKSRPEEATTLMRSFNILIQISVGGSNHVGGKKQAGAGVGEEEQIGEENQTGEEDRAGPGHCTIAYRL
ncbi:hypothetical protein L6452_19927 [Arctium lappa]|uniref:Uncharacterized protein n=1 Tax=Arctium lappa TaxID=4217 RepID=A0ACB9BAB6_ARCLA|nr:hypothetical protein L6452_19927 [Arctium lappa]